jgi:hypothetical protein
MAEGSRRTSPKSNEAKAQITVKMPAMPGRAANITARILFFLGGVVSFVFAALYTMLRGSDLPRQSDWVIFAVVLSLVGAVNVLAAIFPASWTARICRVPDRSSVFSLPPRMFAGFALVSYVVTVGLFFTPHEWNLSGFLWTFLLCPVYIVRETFDPSAIVIFLMLAPMDAAVYGAIGTAIGFALAAARKGW